MAGLRHRTQYNRSILLSACTDTRPMLSFRAYHFIIFNGPRLRVVSVYICGQHGQCTIWPSLVDSKKGLYLLIEYFIWKLIVITVIESRSLITFLSRLLRRCSVGFRFGFGLSVFSTPDSVNHFFYIPHCVYSGTGVPQKKKKNFWTVATKLETHFSIMSLYAVAQICIRWSYGAHAKAVKLKGVTSYFWPCCVCPC